MYWDKAHETMPRPQLEALQLQRLRETVRVAINSPFYRERLKEAGVAEVFLPGSTTQAISASRSALGTVKEMSVIPWRETF